MLQSSMVDPVEKINIKLMDVHIVIKNNSEWKDVLSCTGGTQVG